jgi:hypothetical protein
VVVILVLGALAALLWIGFRNLPDSVEPTPTSIAVPSAPIITGGLDPDAPADEELVPEIVPVDTTVQESVEASDQAVAPTIAPASEPVVVVPNLQGLTIGGSMQAVLPLDLWLIQDQPVYSDTVPLNVVVQQDPPPGTSVSPGAMIRVSLSRGPSPFASADQS